MSSALPRIGLTAGVRINEREELDFTCAQYYCEAVRVAGGEPVVIDPRADLTAVPAQRERFAGLVFTGGPDLCGDFVPAHPENTKVHPLRQEWDLALLKAALFWPDMPLLCICLGCQELNVACGGTLLPHLPDRGTEVEHRRFGTAETWHAARVHGGSLLADIAGSGEIQVNSSHHQAVDRLGEGLRIVARARDGTVEALESATPSERFLLGVQWHPERIVAHSPHLAIFQAFVKACA